MDDAKAWRKYHNERVEYLKTQKDLPPRVLESAVHAQETFEAYLLKKGYVKEEGGEVSTPILARLMRFMSSVMKGILGLITPESAYAFLFGKEDFESCGALPCSFTTNASWGSVAPSIDSGSLVSGVKSLKEVVSGEGGGGMESTNYNTNELWVQFKVKIPDPMVWGGSGFVGILMLEDPSDNSTIWINLEDWGAPRLTVAGDVLGYTDTGLNLVEGAVNTIEMRVKIGSSNGDIDIWLNNTTQGSPDYNGPGNMNTGTDNVDDVIAGLVYSPENGPSTTYYDDIIIDSAFIGTGPANTSPDVIQDISYTYDNVGNITQITDVSDTGAAKTVTYGYDDLYRLTSASTGSASSSSFSQTYSYNSIGNITNKSDLGSYSYAGTGFANPHAATTINGTSLTYDNNGNLTAYGSNSYAWDYANRMTRAGTGSVTSHYGYDYKGDRVAQITNGIITRTPSKLFSTASATTTKQIYAGADLIATVTTSGITLDATSSDISTGFSAGTTKNFKHSTSGDNRLLVLFADIWQDVAGTGSITSATYNGVALTKATTTLAGAMASEIWYLVNPALGSNTISVNISGNTDARKLAAATFMGVDQTSPRMGTSTAIGFSGNPTISLTPTAENALIATTLSRFGAIDATSSRTSIFKDAVTSTLGAASYQSATTTTNPYTDTYTVNGGGSADWAIAMIALRPARGIGTTTTYIVHKDHLGGTNAVTDNNGNLAQAIDYYPFGSLRINVQNGGLNEKRKFTGHEYDSEVALTYMMARYYDGATGRFLSQDPVLWEDPAGQNLENPQSLNSYSYALNNPINKVDSDGRQATPEQYIKLANDLGALIVLLYSAVATLNNPGFQHAVTNFANEAGRFIQSVTSPYPSQSSSVSVGGQAFSPSISVPSGSQTAMSTPITNQSISIPSTSFGSPYVNYAQRVSLPTPGELKGKTAEEIDQLMKGKGIQGEPSRGGGTRYPDPGRPGNQVRVEPGNPADPNPVKQGPYGRVSENGKVSEPFPLKGNPTLRK